MPNKTCFFIVLILILKINHIMAKDTFTNQEIQKLYDTYISVNLTEEYRNRYVPLPLHKNTLPWRWEGKDLPRVFALLEFERFVTQSRLTSNNALAINGINDPEWFYLPHQKLTEWNYETNNLKYDLHSVDLDEKDFDFVIVNQVLEHVYDPIRCLKNVYKHMSLGGILYLNVPANSIPHSVPYHFYTGFTPIGLAVMLKLAGFDILSVGQWGNLEYLNAVNSSHSWPDYTPFKNPGLNDTGNPVITWAFAIKAK